MYEWCGYCVDYTIGPCNEDHTNAEYYVIEPDDQYFDPDPVKRIGLVHDE